MMTMWNSLLPSTLEMIMFFKMNVIPMTMMTIQQALIAVRNTAVATALIEDQVLNDN